ncbi:MAG: serine/threonine protein kinase, partial [Planctomycetaceae bacterium]|nr:serine/threonine protein kinase [Planctomycetaceae bacterium]
MLYSELGNWEPLDFLEPTNKPDRIGELGTYEIIELIGRGGMGVVLKAFDPHLNRIVAIKTLAPDYANNPTARKRFERESRAAAAVAHPHVVTIHAVEPNAKVPYLVMEYVRGQSLREKLDQTGSMEVREILRIGAQIAQGLAAAHDQGLIHRDVKLANVLLENGVERVKLTDFGLARATDDVAITRTGDIAGTPQFMSPEQAEGGEVDHRSDLFSLGSVLYTMCTGRPPFRGETAVAVLRKVCDSEPRPIREVNPDIP